MTHPLVPIVDWLTVTAVAMLVPLWMHAQEVRVDLVEVEQKLEAEQTTLLACEKFAINCLSGRKLDVDGVSFVDCVKLRD